MTLRHFKIFIKVCDTMNMTAAAAALYISQSAVSQAIAELEKHYGARLFERLSRKLYLTREGERLLGYARHMIRIDTDIEKEMKASHDCGSIRLGASVTVSAAVLPSLVAAFKTKYPETDAEVFEDNTAQIEKRLLGDKTDVGLVEGEIISPDIICTPFMDDELVLICGASHRFAGRAVIAQHELENEDFIIREKGSGTRKLFEDAMTLRGLSWKETWTCNNADTIKAAVRAGLGVSVISKMVVAKEVASGELCAKGIEHMPFTRQYKIAYHKDKYITAPMRNFIEITFSAFSK